MCRSAVRTSHRHGGTGHRAGHTAPPGSKRDSPYDGGDVRAITAGTSEDLWPTPAAADSARVLWVQVRDAKQSADASVRSRHYANAAEFKG